MKTKFISTLILIGGLFLLLNSCKKGSNDGAFVGGDGCFEYEPDGIPNCDLDLLHFNPNSTPENEPAYEVHLKLCAEEEIIGNDLDYYFASRYGKTLTVTVSDVPCEPGGWRDTVITVTRQYLWQHPTAPTASHTKEFTIIIKKPDGTIKRKATTKYSNAIDPAHIDQ